MLNTPVMLVVDVLLAKHSRVCCMLSTPVMLVAVVLLANYASYIRGGCECILNTPVIFVVGVTAC